MTGSVAGILRCEIVVRIFSTSTILKARFDSNLTSTSFTISFHLKIGESVLLKTKNHFSAANLLTQPALYNIIKLKEYLA